MIKSSRQTINSRASDILDKKLQNHRMKRPLLKSDDVIDIGSDDEDDTYFLPLRLSMDKETVNKAMFVSESDGRASVTTQIDCLDNIHSSFVYSNGQALYGAVWKLCLERSEALRDDPRQSAYQEIYWHLGTECKSCRTLCDDLIGLNKQYTAEGALEKIDEGVVFNAFPL
jgi:hypothetical protein